MARLFLFLFHRKDAKSAKEFLLIKKDEDIISKEIIGAAIEVHRALGPGLLESIYEDCFCRELSIREFNFKRQLPLKVVYKGIKLNCGYKLDVVIENLVILELKAVKQLEPIHESQLLTYLKLSNLKPGLLINFNEVMLKKGIKRVVNNL